MFEGLGPSAHSAHTQFYNIEAFSSQKSDKPLERSEFDFICAEWADGPRARDISSLGRTMFEGLGPSAHSAHTQFYNIEAFSSQKGDKCSYF